MLLQSELQSIQEDLRVRERRLQGAFVSGKQEGLEGSSELAKARIRRSGAGIKKEQLVSKRAAHHAGGRIAKCHGCHVVYPGTTLRGALVWSAVQTTGTARLCMISEPEN